MNRVVLLALLLATACADAGPAKLTEGERAPGFTLPATQGGQVSLDEFRGEREVLLYFSMGPG